MPQLVTKDMLLGSVVAEHPEAAAVMLEYGLHCVGCFANAYDTVEVGAKVHGMNDAEVDEMVDKVNKRIADHVSGEAKEAREDEDDQMDPTSLGN